MKRFYKSTFCLAFLLPVIVGVTPEQPDSSVTTIGIYGGSGSYALISRGCEDISKDEIPYSEFSCSVDHRFKKSPVRLGINYHFFTCEEPIEVYNSETYFTETHIMTKRLSYIKPYISNEAKDMALGFGGKFFIGRKNEVNFGDYFQPQDFPYVGFLRLGRADQVNFSAHLNDQTLFAKGGLMTARMNFCFPQNKGSLYIGLDGGPPYDGNGFVCGLDLNLYQNIRIETFGRLGSSEGVSENAIGFGLKYQLVGH